ncbi:MAG: hypothetical protein CHACPFDD_03699 [Phycisphaerae bacterium]|nr:hypothetical protein [Phycisphaerae bacterium]
MAQSTRQDHNPIVALIDEGYRGKAWHGTTLKGSLRGLTAREAAWRPAARRHCIAEIAAHCAYWKYTVVRRFRGDKRGSFPLKGSNWFRLPEPFDEPVWCEIRALLDAQHALLLQVAAEVRPAEWHVAPAGSKVSNLKLLHGIALHDVYHTGQVQTIKALMREARR